MLWAKSTWSKAEVEAAAEKVRALNDLAQQGVLAKTSVNRSGPSASSIWASAGRTKPPGADIDHIRDLQLGGGTGIDNMAPLSASVNRSFGAQIAGQLRASPIGTAIGTVTFFASSAANAASRLTMSDVGSFMYDLTPLADIQAATEIKSAGMGSALYGPGGRFSNQEEYNRSSMTPQISVYPSSGNSSFLRGVYGKP